MPRRSRLPWTPGALLVLAVMARPAMPADPRSPREAIAALRAAAERGDAAGFLGGLDAASRDALERSGRSCDHFQAADRQFASAFAERFGRTIPSSPTSPSLQRFLQDLAGLEVLNVVEHDGFAEATVRTIHLTDARAVRLDRLDRLGRSSLDPAPAPRERVNESDILRLNQKAGSWYVALPYIQATLAKANRADHAADALERATAALRDNRIPDEPSALTARREALRLLSAAPSTQAPR